MLCIKSCVISNDKSVLMLVICLLLIRSKVCLGNHCHSLGLDDIRTYLTQSRCRGRCYMDGRWSTRRFYMKSGRYKTFNRPSTLSEDSLTP